MNLNGRGVFRLKRLALKAAKEITQEARESQSCAHRGYGFRSW
jgi:hypothetical protein